MAHKKAGGSTSLGRDSISKRLGVKVYGNQYVKKGGIIVRQHGTRYQAGKNVKVAGDSTLYSLMDGLVKFQHKMLRKFHGNLRKTRVVSVVAGPTAAPKAKAPVAKAEKATVAPTVKEAVAVS